MILRAIFCVNYQFSYVFKQFFTNSGCQTDIEFTIFKWKQTISILETSLIQKIFCPLYRDFTVFLSYLFYLDILQKSMSVTDIERLWFDSENEKNAKTVTFDFFQKWKKYFSYMYDEKINSWFYHQISNSCSYGQYSENYWLA
jgi:hypothetical protein